MWVHDDCVMQGVTDGHKTIISHHCQKCRIHTIKKDKKDIYVNHPTWR